QVRVVHINSNSNGPAGWWRGRGRRTQILARLSGSADRAGRPGRAAAVAGPASVRPRPAAARLGHPGPAAAAVDPGAGYSAGSGSGSDWPFSLLLEGWPGRFAPSELTQGTRASFWEIQKEK